LTLGCGKEKHSISFILSPFPLVLFNGSNFKGKNNKLQQLVSYQSPQTGATGSQKIGGATNLSLDRSGVFL
jgi:hypothetical protein